MALVFGCESTSSFSPYSRVSATQHTMISPEVQSHTGRSETTSSGPSNSSPMSIKPRPDSKLPTPDNSYDDQPKTPEMIHRKEHDAFKKAMPPPTPGDELPEKARPKGRSMVDIKDAKTFLESAKHRSKPRTEDLLAKLRASLDYDAILPVEMDENTFRAVEEALPDAGGYIYDPRIKKLIIKMLPGPMHERVVEVFDEWLKDLVKDSGQRGKVHVDLNWTQKLLPSMQEVVADCRVANGDGPPTVIVEVGVSQDKEELINKAQKWIVEGGARLVILVKIYISKCSPERVGYLSFGNSAGSNSGSDSQPWKILPYDLQKEDLIGWNNETVKKIQEKIVEWYKKQNPPKQLVRLHKVKMYLYRRDDREATGIAREGKFKLADEEALYPYEGYITRDDIQIPEDKIEEKIPFPTSERFGVAFETALLSEANETATARAISLIIGHTPCPETESKYQSSSRQASSMPKNVPITRGRVKRSKDKGTAQVMGQESQPALNHSFRSDGSGIFHLSSFELDADPQYSQQSSVGVPTLRPEFSMAENHSVNGELLERHSTNDESNRSKRRRKK